MPDVKHFDPNVALERAERLFWREGAANASIQDLTVATGLNRSSLYATFGGKRDLYHAALRRYVHHRAFPAFQQLADDDRGLPALRDFFAGLVQQRCTGEYAGWGCLVVNAHTGAERDDPEVRALLDEHHQRLLEAFRTALETARRHGQLPTPIPADTASEALALLAYGVNVHSRNGADADTLLSTVTATLALLGLNEAKGDDA
jgi:TetR/AcrR family transcriptional repressor of nem operon